MPCRWGEITVNRARARPKLGPPEIDTDFPSTTCFDVWSVSFCSNLSVLEYSNAEDSVFILALCLPWSFYLSIIHYLSSATNFGVARPGSCPLGLCFQC